MTVCRVARGGGRAHVDEQAPLYRLYLRKLTIVQSLFQSFLIYNSPARGLELFVVGPNYSVYH